MKWHVAQWKKAKEQKDSDFARFHAACILYGQASVYMTTNQLAYGFK